MPEVAELQPTLEAVWTKPETLTDTRMHYCPGCGHGVVHKIGRAHV